MTTDTAVAPDSQPQRQAAEQIVTEHTGFPKGLEKFSLYFSVFLVVFPFIAIVEAYLSAQTILISLPLFLMFICGVFGTRLALHLERHRVD